MESVFLTCEPVKKKNCAQSRVSEEDYLLIERYEEKALKSCSCVC